jgi:hypothetical protein
MRFGDKTILTNMKKTLTCWMHKETTEEKRQQCWYKQDYMLIFTRCCCTANCQSKKKHFLDEELKSYEKY